MHGRRPIKEREYQGAVVLTLRTLGTGLGLAHNGTQIKV